MKIEMEERQCPCGIKFKVMTSSKQKFHSFDCANMETRKGSGKAKLISEPTVIEVEYSSSVKPISKKGFDSFGSFHYQNERKKRLAQK